MMYQYRFNNRCDARLSNCRVSDPCCKTSNQQGGCECRCGNAYRPCSPSCGRARQKESVTFSFYKVDSVTRLGLPAAIFSLIGSDGCALTGVSNETGMVQFCIRPYVNYTLTETSPPAGYEENLTSYTVVADRCDNIFVNGALTNLLSIPNVATTTPTSFTVAKIDGITGLPLAGSQFTLFSGITAVATSTSSITGALTFTGLASGMYTLQETMAPIGYQPSTKISNVVVAMDETVTIDGLSPSGFTISNIPSSRFAFTKTNAATGAPLGGVEFTLTPTVGISTTETSTATGLVDFGVLAAGEYSLTESSVLPGFEPNTINYTVMVSTTGIVTINGAPISDFSVGNVPMPGIFFTKVDASTGAALAGAQFQLSQGGTVIATATSNAAGFVSFASLVPGAYTLQESVPPTGYSSSLTTYAIVVNALGAVTVNGAAFTDFTVPNTPLV